MNVSKFGISDYLDSHQMVSEYLRTVREEGNDADVIAAIGHAAKAKGLSDNLHFQGITETQQTIGAQKSPIPVSA